MRRQLWPVDRIDSVKGANSMDTETGFGLSTIGQIAIAVRNLDEQTAFYGDKLGMKLLFRVPNMTFFDGGGVRLMLSVPESAEFDHPASIIYFKVADIHEAYEVLSKRGVKFERQPQLTARMEKYDLWMAFLRDPENNVLGIMADVAT